MKDPRLRAPQSSTLAGSRAPWSFAVGVALVTVGVLAHLPMLWMSRAVGFRMVGLEVGLDMGLGMVAIILGIAIACYGLLPRDIARDAQSQAITISPPEDQPLAPAHWRLMTSLVLALAIDIMKPASLGFTIPGMMDEYRLSIATASLVPFAALSGTVLGSLLWGAIADLYGRKASILLSAVMFVGTSICGAMPSFYWNVGMCFMMGAAAGGMLPVTYALLAEMMPTAARGWALILVGGLGSLGGFFLASALSALLQPQFGWRVMWLLNLPTGLSLVMLCALIPESARFLLARGRKEEAYAVMRQFGSTAHRAASIGRSMWRAESGKPRGSRGGPGKLLALSLVAISYGLTNFGLLLWLPTELLGRGYSVNLSSKMLAESALIALPTIFVAAALYSRWSTKWSLFVAIVVTLCGLAGVFNVDVGGTGSPVVPVALLIIGTNAMIAMLLPYTAESFALGVRGRATGTVAACTKAGGMLAQCLAFLALVPSLTVVAFSIAIPTSLSLFLIARFGTETRGLDLRDLDPDGRVFDATGI